MFLFNSYGLSPKSDSLYFVQWRFILSLTYAGYADKIETESPMDRILYESKKGLKMGSPGEEAAGKREDRLKDKTILILDFPGSIGLPACKRLYFFNPAVYHGLYIGFSADMTVYIPCRPGGYRVTAIGIRIYPGGGLV